MNYKILIKILFLSVLPLLVWCCNAEKSNGYNEMVTEHADSAFYKSGKAAYRKINRHNIIFYAPSGEPVMQLNNGNRLIVVYNEMWAERLFDIRGTAIPISRFLYFLPLKYAENHKFSTGSTGTVSGDFYSSYATNKLGLPSSGEQDIIPGDRVNLKWNYNGLGQLLQSYWGRRTNIKNTYDEKARLVKQVSELKKEEYFYDDSDRLQKISRLEKILIKVGKYEKESKTIYHSYDEQGKLSREYVSADDFINYTYNAQGRITKELIYKANPDKDDRNRIISKFRENLLVYDEQGLLIKETENVYEYNRNNKLILDNWVEISIAEQKKEAWKMFEMRKQELFRKGEVSSYHYNANGRLITADKKVYFYGSGGKTADKVEQGYLYEQVTYGYNNNGQITERKLRKAPASGKDDPTEITIFQYGLRQIR